jgi:glycine cleavage system H protein
VTGINPALADAPETLNSDPHGAGWLVKIRLAAPEEASALMNAVEYQSYVGAEK